MRGRNFAAYLTSQDTCIQQLKEKLNENSKNEFIKEQYKLIVDSTHKISERTKDSNSTYITINSIFIPFLIKFYEIKSLDLRNLIVFTCLIGIGVLICINWLGVIRAYRNINHTNFLFIDAFEQHLPTSVFSLRAQFSDPPAEKGNFILHKEKVIPYIFITVYVLLYIVNIWDLILKSS